MDEYNKIYPQLPSEDFRLKQSSDYLSELEKELESRDKIYEKYNSLFKILVKVSSATGFVSLILSGSGAGTALTGVGLPVGVSLATLGGFFGLVSFSTAISLKKIYAKVVKHEKIVSLCQNKINTIREIVSKALKDGKISHEEFLSVKSEVEKYYEMKKSIKRKKKLNIKRNRKQRRNETANSGGDDCQTKSIVFKIEFSITKNRNIRPPPYNPSY